MLECSLYSSHFCHIEYWRQVENREQARDNKGERTGERRGIVQEHCLKLVKEMQHKSCKEGLKFLIHASKSS